MNYTSFLNWVSEELLQFKIAEHGLDSLMSYISFLDWLMNEMQASALAPKQPYFEYSEAKQR